MTRRVLGVALLLLLSAALPASAQQWVAGWTGASQGPYPVGNPTAQPELKFALPSPETGARDQTFRLIVKPDVWGPFARIRLSNVFGKKPITFDDIYVGLQDRGATVMPDTQAAVTFRSARKLTLQPGESLVSDPISLAFVKIPAEALLTGRKLAVSFHVVGESGPMTWHAKALTTSYISPPGSGSVSRGESEKPFPYSTTSWFFLDELDMLPPRTAYTIVAFGDSITDGTATTINGDDRWTDVLSRRLHAAYGDDFSTVNEGIGGNQVLGPEDYDAKPYAGGPSALSRLKRDVIALPNVKTVIWLEGINDFGYTDATVAAVMDGFKQGVTRLRDRIPGVKIFVGTLTSALNSTPTHGRSEVDERRKALNQRLKSSKLFDGVIDFDAVTGDPATGELKAEYQPNSSTGGPGDKLHPNRAGYAAMGNEIDLARITGRPMPGLALPK